MGWMLGGAAASGAAIRGGFPAQFTRSASAAGPAASLARALGPRQPCRQLDGRPANRAARPCTAGAVRPRPARSARRGRTRNPSDAGADDLAAAARAACQTARIRGHRGLAGGFEGLAGWQSGGADRRRRHGQPHAAGAAEAWPRARLGAAGQRHRRCARLRCARLALAGGAGTRAGGAGVARRPGRADPARPLRAVPVEPGRALCCGSGQARSAGWPGCRVGCATCGPRSANCGCCGAGKST